MHIRPLAVASLLVGAFAVACDAPADSPSDVAPTDAVADAAPDVTPNPAAALAPTLGIDRYVGAITPIEERRARGAITYTFDPAEGPVCMRGAPYRASVRETGSDDLVIFLQGGGACWSGFCLAVVGAPPGIPGIDILDPDDETNPVRDWNAVYLPYCDGSFFAGDRGHDDDINGNGPREHRGLANLTGALEVARLHFESPRRVLLAGSSGGAYGLLLAGPLVRHYYPDAELILMADSGIGLGRAGETDYIDTILAEFGVADFLPADCADCRVDGHITALIDWYLARDPNVRMGLYSAWYDSVLADIFLQIAPERFADALAEETRALNAAWPDRFRRFITDGVQHTSLLGNPLGIIGADLTAVELPEGALEELLGGGLVIEGMVATEIDGLTMAAWLGGLIDGDLDVWVDIEAPRGPPPAAAPTEPAEQ